MGESLKTRPQGRLIQTPDFGPMLEKDNAQLFDLIRLEKTRVAINNSILALSSNSESRSAVSVSHQPPVFFRRYAVAMGLATLIFSAGASGYLVYRNIVEVDVEEDVTPASVAPKKSVLPDRRKKRQDTPMVDEQKPIASIEVEVETPNDTLQKDVTRRIVRPLRENATDKLSVDPKVENSILEAQLKVFKNAKKLAKRGAYRRALNTLDDLDRQHPYGFLHIESMELRAKCLYHTSKYSEAANTLRALLKEPVSAGKKAQFFRMLGDSQSRMGQCDLAKESYRRGLGLGLEGEQAAAAKMGIKKCTL